MVDFVASKDDKILIDNYQIITRWEHQYIYEIVQTIEIGTAIDFDLKDGEEYILYFNNEPSGKYKLYRKFAETMKDTIIHKYTFVNPVNYDILNNRIPNNRTVNAVSMKSFIKQTSTQLEYIKQGLRKKGLCLLLDPKTKKAKQKHIMEAINQEPTDKLDIGSSEVKELSSPKRKGYYTTSNEKGVVVSKKTQGFAKHEPYLSKSEIKGLSTYIVPKYEVKTNLTRLIIGDVLIVNKKKAIVMEKEVFNFKKLSTTTLILGVPSK